jgi:hypothetical protein
MYLERFQNCISVLKHCRETVAQMSVLRTIMALESKNINPDKATKTKIGDTMKAASEQCLVIVS